MPKNKTQGIIFGIIMSYAMAFGMEIYNTAINHGYHLAEGSFSNMTNVVFLDALKEMHRVLVPGGRACILEFAPVDIPIFGALYHWYLRTIMPRLAGLICSYPEAYTYLADTVQNFPRPVEFCEELRNAGFPFVTYTSLTLGVANLHIAVKGA